MSVKPDWWIRERARAGMIEPFEEGLVRDGVISYGLSSFGYDLRAQYFAALGYAVVEPNYRGSDGFGRDHRNLLP